MQSPLLAAAAATALRVVSFNLWGVPIITPDRAERMDEIALRLAELHPDLVALQEVWEDEDAARLAPALAAAGLTEQRHYGARLAGGRGAGLFMASRYPIVGERFGLYEVGRKQYISWHLDYMSNKGAAVLDIQTPGGVVRFASTHLQSHYAFGDYTFIQLAQVGTLVETVEQGPVDAPIILAGDINSEPGSLVTDAIRGRLELVPAGNFRLDVIMAHSTSAIGMHVERVQELWEDPVTFHNGMRRTLSDHPCVVADYAMGPCGDCPPAAVTWADVKGPLRSYLDSNAADTRLFILICKTFTFLLPIFAWLSFRNTRRRKPDGLVLVFSLALPVWLLIAAGWSAYIGWSFGPYKLETIAALRRTAE